MDIPLLLAALKIPANKSNEYRIQIKIHGKKKVNDNWYNGYMAWKKARFKKQANIAKRF